MFSFITGKVLGVFMKFFLHCTYHKYNDLYFVMKNPNSDFVFAAVPRR